MNADKRGSERQNLPRRRGEKGDQGTARRRFAQMSADGRQNHDLMRPLSKQTYLRSAYTGLCFVAPLRCATISTPPREARVGGPGLRRKEIISSVLYGTTSQAVGASSLWPKRSSRTLTLVSGVDT